MESEIIIFNLKVSTVTDGSSDKSNNSNKLIFGLFYQKQSSEPFVVHVPPVKNPRFVSYTIICLDCTIDNIYGKVSKLCISTK